MVKKRELCRKGSLTVEAAGLMSVILFVVMASIYLCFYVHNRAWLTAAAYEAALVGSMEAIKEDGKIYEAASVRGRELANTGFFGGENLSMQIASEKPVTIVYTLDTITPLGNQAWKLNVKGSAAVLDPVKRIRQIKAAAEMIESIGERG